MSTLKLELSAPQWIEEDDDWVCSITLSGEGVADQGQAFGVDSLQAFLLALQMAHAKIEYLKRTKGLIVAWNGGMDLGLGG